MLSDLPDILSGEQVRIFLHISKRKCSWMLNNGFIKCQNTGKQTRKYTILKKDLIYYIKDSKAHPEKYVTPYAEFSAVKYAKPYQRKTAFPHSLPKGFRGWLEKEFENVSDVLTIPNVIVTTGYTDNAVDRWIRKGHLQVAQTQSGRIVAKDWLIDFYCSYGYTIVQMSPKHIALMEKFLNR